MANCNTLFKLSITPYACFFRVALSGLNFIVVNTVILPFTSSVGFVCVVRGADDGFNFNTFDYSDSVPANIVRWASMEYV